MERTFEIPREDIVKVFYKPLGDVRSVNVERGERVGWWKEVGRDDVRVVERKWLPHVPREKAST